MESPTRITPLPTTGSGGQHAGDRLDGVQPPRWSSGRRSVPAKAGPAADDTRRRQQRGLRRRRQADHSPARRRGSLATSRLRATTVSPAPSPPTRRWPARRDLAAPDLDDSSPQRLPPRPAPSSRSQSDTAPGQHARRRRVGVQDSASLETVPATEHDGPSTLPARRSRRRLVRPAPGMAGGSTTTIPWRGSTSTASATSRSRRSTTNSMRTLDPVLDARAGRFLAGEGRHRRASRVRAPAGQRPGISARSGPGPGSPRGAAGWTTSAEAAPGAGARRSERPPAEQSRLRVGCPRSGSGRERRR